MRNLSSSGKMLMLLEMVYKVTGITNHNVVKPKRNIVIFTVQ